MKLCARLIRECLESFGQESTEATPLFVKGVGEVGEGATRVCLCIDSRGKGCMFRIYLSALCLLLLCISGRELGSSTKSQEGLLDTRVINFFRVPMASV